MISPGESQKAKERRGENPWRRTREGLTLDGWRARRTRLLCGGLRGKWVERFLHRLAKEKWGENQTSFKINPQSKRLLFRLSSLRLWLLRTWQAPLIHAILNRSSKNPYLKKPLNTSYRAGRIKGIMLPTVVLENNCPELGFLLGFHAFPLKDAQARKTVEIRILAASLRWGSQVEHSGSCLKPSSSHSVVSQRKPSGQFHNYTTHQHHF